MDDIYIVQKPPPPPPEKKHDAEPPCFWYQLAAGGFYLRCTGYSASSTTGATAPLPRLPLDGPPVPTPPPGRRRISSNGRTRPAPHEPARTPPIAVPIPPQQPIRHIAHVARRRRRPIAQVLEVHAAGIIRPEHGPQIPHRPHALPVEQLHEARAGRRALRAIDDHLRDGRLHVLRIVRRDRGVVALHEAAVLDAVVAAGRADVARGFLDDDGEDDARVDFGFLRDGDDGVVDGRRFGGGVADGQERVLLVAGEHGFEGHPVPEGDLLREGGGGAGEALVGAGDGVAGGASGEVALVVCEGDGVGHGGGGAVAGGEGGEGGGEGEGEEGGKEELEGEVSGFEWLGEGGRGKGAWYREEMHIARNENDRLYFYVHRQKFCRYRQEWQETHRVTFLATWALEEKAPQTGILIYLNLCSHFAPAPQAWTGLDYPWVNDPIELYT